MMRDPFYSDRPFTRAFVERDASRFLKSMEVDCGMTQREALDCNPFMLKSARALWAREIKAAWAFSA